MEGVHPLFLVVLMVLSLLHSYADAQGNIISNPPLGITLRDYLKATMSVMLLGFFSAFVLMFFFRLFLRHCSNGYRAGNNSIAPAAVDLCGGRFNRQVIDKCPILLYSTVKELKMGKGALECAVCLSEFEECDKIRLLPKCRHVFHPDCIDGWLLAQMNCPVCRAKLTYSDTLLDVAIPVIPTESQQELEGQSSGAVTECVTETVMEEGTIIPARKSRVLGKFPRSHSTGHSIVGPEEDVENDRYTLILPEHVRKQILNTSGGLALPGEWRSKRVWNGERWSVSMTTTPLTLSFTGVQGRAQAPSSNIPPL